MTKGRLAYKIVETHQDGRLRTLFHGHEGSRVIPMRRWLRAKEVMVTDGSRQEHYLSGWHVLPTRKAATAYLTAFTRRLNRLRIVPCRVRVTRRKPGSPHPVMLARYMWVG